MTRLATTLTLCLALALAAGCAADRPPDEITDDGLVRVPSRSVGGVYRAPEASFTQYQRVILEPPSISFVDKWVEKHPEVSKAELARIRNEAIEMFRKEFAREFVERGPYKFAEDPAPDVLLVIPSIEDLDITAPDAGVEPGRRTYTTASLSMKIKGDMRDAATGKLIGRVIMIQPAERYAFNELRIANRATNAHEQSLAYSKWVRLAHEALNVAKAERPRKPTGR